MLLSSLVLGSCNKKGEVDRLDSDTNITRIVRKFGLKTIKNNRSEVRAAKEFKTFKDLENYLEKREHLVDTLSLSPTVSTGLKASNNKKGDVDFNSGSPITSDYRYLIFYSEVFKSAQFPSIIIITMIPEAGLKLQYDGANLGTWYFNQTYAHYVNDVLPTKCFIGDGVYTEVFSVGGIFQYEKSYSFNAELSKVYSYSTPQLYARYKPLAP